MPKPRPVSKRKLAALTEQLAELIRLHGPKHALIAFSKAKHDAYLILKNGEKQKRPRGRPKAEEQQRTASEKRDFRCWLRIKEYLAEHPHETVSKAAAWLSDHAKLGKRKTAKNTLRTRFYRIETLHQKDPERAKKHYQLLKEVFGIEPVAR